MDLQTFTALVSGSPLIPAELKTKLLAEAVDYSPEKRDQIAAVIRKTEEGFLAAAKAKQAEMAFANAAAGEAKRMATKTAEAQQCAIETTMIDALEAEIAAM